MILFNRSTPFSVFLVRIFYYLLILSATLITLIGIKILFVPILISLIVFYIFNGFVDSIESYGVKRELVVGFIFALLIAIIYVVVSVILPPLVSKLSPLLQDWTNDELGNRFKFMSLNISIKINDEGIDWAQIIKPETIIAKAIEYVKNSIDTFIAFLPSLLTYLLITPFISFILLLSGSKIFKNLVSLVPNRFFEMTMMLSYKINEQITNYLKSLMIQGILMACIVSLGLYFAGIPYFYIFAIFVGVANSIPYVGPIIGAVPPIIYIFLNNGTNTQFLEIFAVIGIAQLFDNFVIQPAIIARSVSLHPLMMLGGVVVGGELFGLTGMFIAVPALSILKVTITILYKSLKDYKII